MDQTSEEIIEGLRKSKKILGPIDRVLVKNMTMEIIDGKHRKRADPTWPEENVEGPQNFPWGEDIYFVLLRMHRNYRRQVSRKETQAELLMLASMLEDKGVSREKIISKLSRESEEGLTPYSETYIRNLLPAKYKATQGQAGGIKSGMMRRIRSLQVNTPNFVTEEKPGIVFEHAAPEVRRALEPVEKPPSEIRKFEPKEEVSKASGLEPTLNVEVECGTQVATGSQGADAEKTAVTFESAAPAIKPKPPKTVVCPHCHLDLEIVLCSSC